MNVNLFDQVLDFLIFFFILNSDPSSQYFDEEQDLASKWSENSDMHGFWSAISEKVDPDPH